MRARFQADQDDRFAASVDKVPGGVINGDVDMTDARRHVEGSFAEDRHDAQIFRPVLDEDAPLSQRLVEAVDRQSALGVPRFRWRPTVMDRECPWRSGERPPATGKLQAAMAATYLRDARIMLLSKRVWWRSVPAEASGHSS